MLRTIVRGIGRGNSKPIILGDEAIDLRAFKNSPGKGYMPNIGVLDGQHQQSNQSNNLTNRLRNRNNKSNNQSNIESGQFDDAKPTNNDHSNLINVINNKQRNSNNRNSRNNQNKKSQQVNSKNSNDDKQKEGLQAQKRASSKQPNNANNKVKEFKPKLKEIEIDRLDLSQLVFEQPSSIPLPTTSKSTNEINTLSEEENLKQHMEIVGGDYARYNNHSNPLKHALSSTKSYTLNQKQDLVHSINAITGNQIS